METDEPNSEDIVPSTSATTEFAIPPELSISTLAETHPDAQTPGFVLEVPDTFMKKFIFRSRSKSGKDYDVITVLIPEKMTESKAGYGLRIWPCAPILAWYLFEHREFLVGQRVLELGAGTSLPGIVAAKCGAQVVLTDSFKYLHCLETCQMVAEMNEVGDKVRVMGLTWGLFLNNVTKLRNQVDLVIGADCFFDPTVFEDLVSTVAYILENNPSAKFLTTYQVRSSDWSIEHLLNKWGLQCKHVPLKDLANRCRIDLLGMMQNHTIHLLEITLKS